MNPHSYVHLIFDKGTKNIWREIASSTNVAGKSGYLPEKTEVRSIYSTLY
jgi:hypothetical protein